MEDNNHVFVNVYRNTSLYFHHGIVAFGKEYFMNESGVKSIDPGTWRDQEPIASRSTPVKTEKSENDFDQFLKHPLFDASNFGHLDNKTFSTLAYEFLTLENPTQTKTYSRAMDAVSKEKDITETEVYINKYISHSGIVVYGKEYFYTPEGLDVREPGTWKNHKPLRQEKHAITTVSEMCFKEIFLASEKFNINSAEYQQLDSPKFANLAFEFLERGGLIERTVYINTYDNLNGILHYGVVAFEKEYFLENDKIEVKKPGTSRNKRPFPSFTKPNRKTKKQFEMFLTQPRFDNRLSRIDNKTFSELAYEFLTHENPTETPTYLRAITSLGGEESDSESKIYINVYKHILPGCTHSGVVVFGREYFFSSDGVGIVEPGKWDDHGPKWEDAHSVTKVSRKHFEDQFLALEHFQSNHYSLIKFNCNDFTTLAYQFLTAVKPLTPIESFKAQGKVAWRMTFGSKSSSSNIPKVK